MPFNFHISTHDQRLNLELADVYLGGVSIRIYEGEISGSHGCDYEDDSYPG
jgi:hypothetical protein